METAKLTNINHDEKEADQFLAKLQALQEVNLELARKTTLADLYRAAIELGRTRLGFDRLGLLLYDENTNMMIGTFGTDDQGEIRDERDFRQIVNDERLLTILSGQENLGVWENTELHDIGKVVGTGWNAMSVLWSGEKGIGWLAADNHLNHAPLEKRQLDILQLYGANLGHLVIARQLDQQQKELLERRTRQVQISTQVAQDIAEATNLDDLYQRIVTKVKEQFGYYHTQLLRYNSDKNVVELIAGYGDIGAKMLANKHQMPMGQGIIGTAAATGESILRSDLIGDPDWSSNPLLPETKGEIAVPIKLGKEILGVLDVQSDTPHALGSNDQLLLEGLCGQIALAINTTRLNEERLQAQKALNQSEETLRETLDRQQVLHDISLELSSIQDLDELYKQVIINGRERLGFDRIGLFLVALDVQELRGTYGINPQGELVSIKHDIFNFSEGNWVKRIVYSQESVFVREDADLLEGQEIIGRGWHLTATMRIRGNLIGVMFADNIVSQQPFQPHLPELFSAYSTDAANLIDRLDSELRLRESEQTLQAFLEKQQSLQEIGIQLSAIENPINLYEKAIELGSEKLGFERLGLYLLDPTRKFVHGTFGIGTDGILRNEFDDVFVLADEPWMHTHLYEQERLRVNEDLDLFQDGKVVGHGWNIKTALWVRDTAIGIMFADNLLTQGSLKPYQAELLASYGATIANLIDRARAKDERERLLTDTEEQAKQMAQLADNLQTVADLSTQITSIQDPQLMMEAIVEKSKERFALYHAHIYLFDESGKNLVLAAGAGDVGKIMVKEGYSIPLKQENSLVARAARTKKGVVVNNVVMDLNFLPNPLLSETRSEMAVPMISGNQVLGVLDVQADTTDRFTNEDVQIQMTLAAQTAVALQNARQYEKTQQALANATTFRQLVDASSQGIGITSLNKGETIYVNSALAHLFHIADPEKDLYGKTLGEFLQEEARIRYQEEILPTMMAHGSWEGEMWLGDPENPTITYENHFILRDDAGNPTYTATIISDITERKAAEEAVRANRNLMRAIIDISPDWIIVKSRENRYVLVNQAFSDYIGVPVEDMVGKDDIEIGFDEEVVRGNPEKGIPGFWPEDQQVMDSGEIFQKDDTLEDFGQIRYNSTVKTPFKDEEGNVTGLVVFVHDITPQKSAELMLAKRAEELQSVAELSTAVATTSDPQQLLQDVVDLAKERFELYHAHIYLLDDSGRNLVLTAGAGEAGAIMVKEGFSIPLKQEKSLVARAARDQKGVIVNDVMADPGFLANPLLPDTRSEMAVPMITGNRVLGVLDVQSTQVEGFNSEDIKIQLTLAAQISVALENVRSLEKSRKAIEELDKLTRRLTRESWEAYVSELEKEETELVYSFGELAPVDLSGLGEVEGETAVSPTNGQHSKSLMVRGEAIGQLTVFNETETQGLDADTALIIAAVAEQLSARVENIRLTEQTQQALTQTQTQALRLGLLNEISAEMSNAETLNKVFDIIFARIPALLKADRVSLAMLQPDKKTLNIIGFQGSKMDMPTGTIIPLENSAMSEALEKRKIIVDHKTSLERGIKSSMVAPIFSAGNPVGTLNIVSDKSNALTEQDETLLQQLATMLSSVIENKQLLAAAQARAERERQVRTITDRIRRGVDREAILNIAQKEISQLIGAKQSAAQLGTKAQLLERIQNSIEQTQHGSD